MKESKSNFKTIYFTFVVEIIAAIIILILTYILNLNLILFVIMVIALISIIVLTYIGYLIGLKSKEATKKKREENKRKRILDLDWKAAQPPEREKFMEWMDDL